MGPGRFRQQTVARAALQALFFLWMSGLTHSSLASPTADASGDARRAQCESLSGFDFSKVLDAPTQITSATPVGASGATPGFCRVKGYVVPRVGIEIRLPDAWNSKYVQVGCIGHCGIALDGYDSTICDDFLSKGYACLASDMGHDGTASDGLWGYNNLQAKIDWGFRATHVAALAGKAIIERYYIQVPNRSYFLGCSTGGRQALQEAQHFPWDFDGIVAGAPPVDLSKIYMTFAWGIRASHDSAGNSLLGPDALKLLTAAAVAKCDMDDGVKDGVIADPLHCVLDLTKLICKPGQAHDCLTAAQIDVAQRIYAGPMTSRGVKLSLGGPLPGSESSGWSSAYTGVDGKDPGYESLVTDGFRYLLFFPEAGPTWKLQDFDFDRDYRRLGIMQALYDSSNPDLREFKAAGGKMISFQGMNDNSVLPRSTIGYYEAVERTMGGQKATQDFFRLFLLPGVGHCSGGDGADAADFLAYLEKWVEKGEAPVRILTGHLKSTPTTFGYPYRQFPDDATALRFTRPAYPYPLRAKFKGSGDPNNADNFVPVGVP